MDSQHESDLQRILEKRKQRGVKAPSPSPSPASVVPTVHSSQEFTSRSSVAQNVPVQSRAISQQVAPRPDYTNDLLQKHDELKRGQFEQQKKLESVQNELRQGLKNMENLLSRHSTEALTKERKRQFELPPPDDMRNRVDFANPRQISSSMGESRVQMQQSTPSFLLMQEDESQMPRNIPLPVLFNNKTGKIEGSTPGTFDFQTGKRVTPKSAPKTRQGPSGPQPPPPGAQPYAVSTIDIDSSVTVLRSGDWFLKWNARGSDVQPRYVWLDTEKYIISWGKERGASSLLSGHIQIEEIQDVSTSQIVEHFDDKVRVFYLLLVRTANGKMLQLATEKRDKLDIWFDALNNIAMFYRVRGQLLKDMNPSTE